MCWIDWTIFCLPLIAILLLALYSGKYVRGVADYLVAGRVAGRYVISVGDLLYVLVCTPNMEEHNVDQSCIPYTGNCWISTPFFSIF